MTTKQRTENDQATMDKREMVDKTRRENRDRNDELTKERRYHADKNMNTNRLRNDEITKHRRKMNDRNPWRTLAIFLLFIAVLVVGAYYFFF